MSDAGPKKITQDNEMPLNDRASGCFIQIYDRILDLSSMISGVLLIFLMLSVCMEVGLRYFLGKPTSWVVEISGYILLYIPFLVAAWVLKEGGHVQVDFIYSRLTSKTKTILDTVTSCLAALVCLILVIVGLKVSIYYQRLGFKTPTVLMLPKSGIIFVIPLGFFLLTIQFLRKASLSYLSWRELRRSARP